MSPSSSPPLKLSQKKSDPDLLTDLLTFFSDNEIWFDSKLMGIYGSPKTDVGLSVRSKSNIPKNTILCKINKDSVLSIRTSAISDLIEENGLGGGLALVLCLMFEFSQGFKSPWLPYLSCLPDSVDVPLYWTYEDLLLLKGTDLEIQLEKDLVKLKIGRSLSLSPSLPSSTLSFLLDPSLHFFV